MQIGELHSELYFFLSPQLYLIPNVFSAKGCGKVWILCACNANAMWVCTLYTPLFTPWAYLKPSACRPRSVSRTCLCMLPHVSTQKRCTLSRNFAHSLDAEPGPIAILLLYHFEGGAANPISCLPFQSGWGFGYSLEHMAEWVHDPNTLAAIVLWRMSMEHGIFVCTI